jgi:enoyl-CoA hydratase
MNDTENIIFSQQNGLGLIYLNRPQAMNALNLSMIQQLQQQLSQWAHEPDIHAVLITSNNTRAFCAGGDIRQLYALGRETPLKALEFFWTEYRLNYTIKTYPKPYIALLDGVTMGGGVGISQHGSLRVGAESLLFAMPETGIGLFPDIGASYFLPRLPGRIGYHLGLTGARIGLSDTLYLGLTDAFIKRAQWDNFILALSQLPNYAKDTLAALVNQFSEPRPPATLEKYHDLIAEIFKDGSLDEVIERLHKNPDPWCQETLATLQTKSPTSLQVTWEQLKRGAQLTIGECLQQEYRLAYHFLQHPDLLAGIRAVVIEKDQNPQWQPAPQDINHFFAALPAPYTDLAF